MYGVAVRYGEESNYLQHMFLLSYLKYSLKSSSAILKAKAPVYKLSLEIILVCDPSSSVSIAYPLTTLVA